MSVSHVLLFYGIYFVANFVIRLDLAETQYCILAQLLAFYLISISRHRFRLLTSS